MIDEDIASRILGVIEKELEAHAAELTAIGITEGKRGMRNALTRICAAMKEMAARELARATAAASADQIRTDEPHTIQ
jgi:hypothetical protein